MIGDNDWREAVEILKEVVRQACSVRDGLLDAHGISAYAEALKYLARCYEVEIIRETGYNLIAKWRT